MNIFCFNLFSTDTVASFFFFEVGKWVELEDCWVFRASEGRSKIILVEKGILFVDFVDKIYAKLGVFRNMFKISLSYMP